MVSNTINGIQFNADGSFQQISGGSPDISFQIAGLAGTQTVALSPGTTNGFGGLTEFGGSTSAAATSQDGFAAGFLTNLSVGQDGVISGVFTNGQTLAIAQLATASFANSEGLNRAGNNYYTPSADSGEPQIGVAGSGGRGAIQGGSLEGSNVDVSAELHGSSRPSRATKSMPAPSSSPITCCKLSRTSFKGNEHVRSR